MPKTQTAPKQGQLFRMTPEREQEVEESFEAAGKRREKFNTNLTRAVAVLIGRTTKTPSGRNLTRHDMAVLYCDLLTMGGPDGWCYRTDGQLAEELGSHPSTVNKSRRKLRECGFIAVAERVRGRGNQQVLGPMLSLVADMVKASEASSSGQRGQRSSGQGRRMSSGQRGQRSSGQGRRMSSGQGRQSVEEDIERVTSKKRQLSTEIPLKESLCTQSEETRANENENSPTQTLNEKEEDYPPRLDDGANPHDDYSDWANTEAPQGKCLYGRPGCTHDTKQAPDGTYQPICECCDTGNGCEASTGKCNKCGDPTDTDNNGKPYPLCKPCQFPDDPAHREPPQHNYTGSKWDKPRARRPAPMPPRSSAPSGNTPRPNRLPTRSSGRRRGNTPRPSRHSDYKCHAHRICGNTVEAKDTYCEVCEVRMQCNNKREELRQRCDNIYRKLNETQRQALNRQKSRIMDHFKASDYAASLEVSEELGEMITDYWTVIGETEPKIRATYDDLF